MALAPTSGDLPDSGLARIDRVYHRFESFLNAFSAAFIFALMFLAVAEVLMRKIFNSPIHGQADFVEIMVPTIGFFGLAYCHRLAGHVRMEIVLNMLKGRAYWIAEFFGNISTILLCAAMIYGTWGYFLRAYQLGDTSMDAELPIWPPKLIIFLGFCILFVRLIIAFFGYIRLIAHPEATPVGVPVSPTVEEQAEAEARAAREAIDEPEGR